MTETFDVAIVGAGPAGLSAGIVLAQHNLRTLVCEQQRFPVDKVCGEGVMPAGVAHLNRLGVAQHLCEKDVYPFAGIRYHSPRGSVAAASFAEGPGWGIRRTALSSAFLRQAQGLKQLEIRCGVSAEPVATTPARVTLRAGGDLVHARLLIGADGLHSRVRRWAKLGGPRQSLQRWGARRHFQIAPWSEYVEVHWRAGVEAYVTPCGREQVGVAFLWDRARYRHVRGGQALFASLLEAFPELQARLAGARVCSAARAVGPLHQVVISPVGDGVLLIGDAAGYLDAITGEGISLATAQALSLEHTVVPLLHSQPNRVPLAPDLQPYKQAHRAIVSPYYRITRLVLLLSRRPRLAERVIKVLARQPDVFQHLLSANMGLKPLCRLGPAQIIRLIQEMI